MKAYKNLEGESILARENSRKKISTDAGKILPEQIYIQQISAEIIAKSKSRQGTD